MSQLLSRLFLRKMRVRRGCNLGMSLILLERHGGHGRNRTGVYGFAVRCVTTPPRGLSMDVGKRRWWAPLHVRGAGGKTSEIFTVAAPHASII